MKTSILRVFTALLLTTSFSAFADNDHYRLSNDVSYLDGSIDSKQQIYYPGDTLDIRVTMKGNTALLSSQSVDIYLALFNPKGVVNYKQIKEYSVITSQRLYFIENINSSLVVPGTYQVALIATKPGGNPATISDWYNGIAGLLEKEAVLYTETGQSGDNNSDGYWDNDYDRDGFYGDDDKVYKQYAEQKGAVYKSTEYREWSDDNWGDDQDSDWDNRENHPEWDD